MGRRGDDRPRFDRIERDPPAPTWPTLPTGIRPSSDARYLRGGAIPRDADTSRTVADMVPGCTVRIIPACPPHEQARLREAAHAQGYGTYVLPAPREPHTPRGRLARTLHRIAARIDPTSGPTR